MTTKQKINYSIIRNIRKSRNKKMICEFCNGHGKTQYIKNGEYKICIPCEGTGILTTERKDRINKRLKISHFLHREPGRC
jgi:DnaJ-class molecular chaperone